MPTPLTTSVSGPPALLIVDAGAARYLAVLGTSFRAETATTTAAAFAYMAGAAPAGLVVDLDAAEGLPLDLIARARASSLPPAILVLTAEPARVPDAMLAGCDSVLLKPFPPNLIYSRLSRMIRWWAESVRKQSAGVRQHTARPYGSSVTERGELTAGCMREWPHVHCESCDHEGVTSFEYASHRRAWYACLACKKVWMAKRRD